MGDPIAVVSVISSAVVAVAGLLTTYLTGREQRTHDAALAYESRAWGRKSEALLGVIACCRRLIDSIDRDDDDLARSISQVVKELDDLVPMVEAYSTAACRKAYMELRSLLQGSYDVSLLRSAAQEQRWMAESRALGDLLAASQYASNELQVLIEAKAALTVDLLAVRSQSKVVIDTARESFRGRA